MRAVASLCALSLLMCACAGSTSGTGDGSTTTTTTTTAAVSGSRSFVGAGWSFGMCLGYCRADLAVEGTELVLTGGDWRVEEPLLVNRGALTAIGRERLAAALQALGAEPLESIYGCPDCADGGAAYVTLARDGLSWRHDMEFGRPPRLLAEVYGLAMVMIDALESCQSDEVVAVDDDCEPWEGR